MMTDTNKNSHHYKTNKIIATLKTKISITAFHYFALQAFKIKMLGNM